jgi:hypothetical protein
MTVARCVAADLVRQSAPDIAAETAGAARPGVGGVRIARPARRLALDPRRLGLTSRVHRVGAAAPQHFVALDFGIGSLIDQLTVSFPRAGGEKCRQPCGSN